eukprot:1138302-Pelagomonas_calceolata.AAC.5
MSSEGNSSSLCCHEPASMRAPTNPTRSPGAARLLSAAHRLSSAAMSIPARAPPVSVGEGRDCGGLVPSGCPPAAARTSEHAPPCVLVCTVVPAPVQDAALQEVCVGKVCFSSRLE